MGIPSSVIAVAVLSALVSPRAHAACVRPTSRQAHAYVGGHAIDMTAPGLNRLPYGMDVRLDVRPATELTALSVDYALDRSTFGPRSGRVSAQVSADGCTWSAAMPKLHVNETGKFTIDEFSTPALKPGPGGQSALAANFLQELAAVPSPLAPKDFRLAVAARASAAIAATFDLRPGARIVARDVDGSFKPLDELLTISVVEDLSVKNIVSNLVIALFQISTRGQAIVRLNPLMPPALPTCGPGATIGDAAITAQNLVNGKQPAILNAILTRVLPWPECVATMFHAVETLNKAGGTGAVPAAVGEAQVALTALADLKTTTALTGLLALVQRAEALEEASLSVATVDVPVGGDILERYTQADVMTVILPSRYHLVQTFATASLYAFQNWKENPLLTAPVEPQSWSVDRFALQFGYPIGQPLHAADEPIDAQYLVGAQYRLNSVLSVSSGAVMAKISGTQRATWYFATNFDISNLGPFQQLFARRDPP